MYKILIVDDDKDLLKMLKRYFEPKGYVVYLAVDGKEALTSISATPDIILLDVNMPHMNGLEVCKTIRNKVSCPIIFLTAKVEEQDRVNGLLSGGDDYVLKPFSLKELDARITAHLKREQRQLSKSKIKFQAMFVFDYANKNIQYKDVNLEFTKMEFDIIEFLSLHPGQVFDRDRIYEKVCGYDSDADSRVITELIRRIRNKFASYSNENMIETVWGNGYRWKK